MKVVSRLATRKVCDPTQEMICPRKLQENIYSWGRDLKKL